MAGAAAMGVNAIRDTNDATADGHRADRLVLQETLAGLTNQYVKFMVGESAAFASDESWSLTPGDPGDAGRLRRFVDDSPFVDHAAVLTDLRGGVLNAATDGELPSPVDPGVTDMTSSLRAGQPGLSRVMSVPGPDGPTPVVGYAVPVLASGRPVAVLVSFFRPKDSALQTYASGLTYGETGEGYIIDGAGMVVAGTDEEHVGSRLAVAADLPPRSAGRARVVDIPNGDEEVVVSDAEVGLGGWTTLTHQASTEFYGELGATTARTQVALLLLLAIAAGVLVLTSARRDIHMRRHASELEAMAFVDSLTGINNRRGFTMLAEHELRGAARRSASLSMLYVDVDNMKAVNDRFGHVAGDSALVATARLLEATFRKSDVIGRMGGDEFCVLLTDEDEGSPVDRLHENLRADNARSVRPFEMSLSIGAARIDPSDLLGPTPLSVDDVIRLADISMYDVKHGQKAQAHAID